MPKQEHLISQWYFNRDLSSERIDLLGLKITIEFILISSAASVMVAADRSTIEPCLLTNTNRLQMNDEEIEQIKIKLLQMRSEVLELEQSSGESKGTVELDQAKVGRLSRMDAMQLQQMALEEARRRQQKLKKIEGALRRIESDEYGECFICGEEIDPRRLNFDATNTRCIACADK